MRVFVTGGSGFLGRRLIPYLLRRSMKVRALARSPQAGCSPWAPKPLPRVLMSWAT
ncbi:MAG: NAD(P)-dependent oxidoreductase [Gammaproteobacteria bacterium]|nr:NAD(P)-dependent oxidoreductase [Gammaproteobacteria bacterium]